MYYNENSFYDTYYRPLVPHRVVSVTGSGIIEERLFQQHVQCLVEILLLSKHKRVVLRISHLHLLMVSFMAAVLSGKDVLIIPCSYHGEDVVKIPNKDDFVFTDENVNLYGGNAEIINLLNVLSVTAVAEFNLKIYPRINSEKIKVSLLGCEAENGHLIEYTRNLQSVEQEMEYLFNLVPAIIDSPCIACGMSRANSILPFFSVIIALLGRIPLFTTLITSNCCMGSLCVPACTLVGTSEFMSKVSADLVMPASKLFVCIGSKIKPADALKLISILNCKIVQLLGCLETGIIAYQYFNDKNNFRIFPYIKTKKDTDGCLLVSGSLVSSSSIKTPFIVDKASNGFVVEGIKGRIVEFNGHKIGLDVLEKKLIDDDWVTDVAIFSMDDNSNQFSMVITLSTEQNERLKEVGRAEYFNAIRSALKSCSCPDFVVPTRIRIIKQMLYNKAYVRDYSALKLYVLHPDNQQDNSD